MSFNYLVIEQTQDFCLSPESTIATGIFTPQKLLNKMSLLYNTSVKKDCFYFYRQTLSAYNKLRGIIWTRLCMRQVIEKIIT